VQQIAKVGGGMVGRRQGEKHGKNPNE